MLERVEMDPRPINVGNVCAVPGTIPRLLSADPWRRENLASYSRTIERTDLSEAEILSSLEKSDIRGRGGAGFPLLRKVLSIRDGKSNQPVLVVNGEEGEPGSCKDRYLLRFRPHVVLDGALTVAKLINARMIIVYVSDELSADSIHQALSELNCLITVKVIRCTPRYVSGEESALVNYIEHGDGRPMDKPPRVYVSGVSGYPTLVSNVETLAAAAVACRQWEPQDSLLCTLSDGRDTAVLCEVRHGTQLAALTAMIGADEGGCFVPGGLFGGILPIDPRLMLTRDAFADAGSSLGCGAFMFFDSEQSVISVASEVAAQINENIAGQCGSCVNGTRALRDALHGLSLGRARPSLLDDLRRWASGLKGRGACALPDGAAVLVDTLLHYFEADVRSAMGGDPIRQTAVNWRVSVPQPS